MTILALDQASRTSGWAVYENGKLIKYGKFTYEDTDFGERLYKIRNKIQELINTYLPNEIVFEDIQLQSTIGNNVETFKKLAEVFGIVYELATELGISNRAVISTVWKSKLGLLHGKGQDRSAQKREAQIWVQNTYGIKPTQDEVDAICIGAWAVITQETGFDWSD